MRTYVQSDTAVYTQHWLHEGMLGSSQPAKHANSVQPKQYKDKIVSKIVYTLTETQLAASSVGRKSIHGRIITRSQHTDKYGF